METNDRLQSWTHDFLESIERQRPHLVEQLIELANEFDDDIIVELENIAFEIEQLYNQIDVIAKQWDQEKITIIQKLRSDIFVQLDNIELGNREDLKSKRRDLYNRLSSLTEKLIEARKKAEAQQDQQGEVD